MSSALYPFAGFGAGLWLLTLFVQDSPSVKLFMRPRLCHMPTCLAKELPSAMARQNAAIETPTTTQVFWGLDKKLAQRKHFPSVNWLISYSKCVVCHAKATPLRKVTGKRVKELSRHRCILLFCTVSLL